MLRNYLLVALRSIVRNRTLTFINIIGLSLGLACCFLIFTHLRYEWTFDRGHKNHADIYKVIEYNIEETTDDGYRMPPGITALLAPVIEKSIPGVKSVTRHTDWGCTTKIDDILYEEEVDYADKSLFDVFTVPLLKGDPDDQLIDPKSVILTEAMALKYFGKTDVVGRMIDIKTNEVFEPYRISGVIEVTAENSHVCPDMILPFSVITDLLEGMWDSWDSQFSVTYVLLEEGISPDQIEVSLRSEMDRLDVTAPDGRNFEMYYHLQPLTEIHLSLNNPRGFPTETEATGSTILFIIGIAVLIIACINFTTLSIGRSIHRAHEIGVRKAIGAISRQVKNQIWVEIILTATISMSIGLVLTELLLPSYNRFAEMNLQFQYDSLTLLSMILLLATTIVLAGSYPVIVLSSFSPIAAIKNKVRVKSHKQFRRILVFVQFCISASLISITLIMSNQLKHIQSQNLGMNSEQVVSLEIPNRDETTGPQIIERMHQKFDNDPGIVEISGMSCTLGDRWTRYLWEYDEAHMQVINQNTVDYNFLDLMGIRLIEGRNFSKEISSDATQAIIVNRALVEKMGWENPVGKSFERQFRENQIIGVVENFNFKSLHDDVEPLILTINDFIGANIHVKSNNHVSIQNVLVKLAPGQIPETLDRLKAEWASIAPEYNFNYSFLDEEIQRQYNEDQRWISITKYASIFTVIIASLGLFGLSTLQILNRRKEIGIRKVLGSTSFGITVLMAKEITVLVGIANLIALPIVVISMRAWFLNFTTNSGISPLLLISTAVITIAIAWSTVGVLAWKSATQNPVKALHCE